MYKIDKKISNLLILLIFVLFFSLGLSISNDYGMPLDQLEYRQQGFVILNYLGNIFFPDITKSFVDGREIVSITKYQESFPFSGVPLHSTLAFIEVLFDIHNKQEIYYFKYKLLFIFNFIGLVFFYFLLLERYKDRLISLSGVTILITSPRFFPEMFYNPNDIPFLTSIIIFFYFVRKFFVTSSMSNLFLLSFFSGFLVSMRFVGIIFPSFFIILYFLFKYYHDKENLFLHLKQITYYFILTFFFIFLLNPTLWENSLFNILNSISNGISYDIEFPQILYLGQFHNIKNFPWHYLPTWISVSTPIVYLILIFSGLFLFIKTIFFKIKNKNIDQNFIDVFFLISILFCLFVGMFLSKSLINGWRHMYFIYPMLIYFGLFSLKKIKKNIILISIFIISIIYNCFWMINNHPYQMVYFNILAGKNIQDKFELDYWGLSNKNAIENILDKETDKKKIIKIMGESRTRLNFSKYLLNIGDYKRIKITEDLNDADFIITNYNSKKRKNNFLEEGYSIYHEISLDNITINSTFKKPKDF